MTPEQTEAYEQIYAIDPRAAEAVRQGWLLAGVYRLPGESGRSDEYSVYRLSFECGRAYVGLTRRDVLVRVAEHVGCGRDPIATWRLELRNQQGHTGIQQELNHHGVAKIEVLASGLTLDEAELIEMREIALLDMPLNAVGAQRGSRGLCGDGPDPAGEALKWLK